MALDWFRWNDSFESGTDNVSDSIESKKNEDIDYTKQDSERLELVI